MANEGGDNKAGLQLYENDEDEADLEGSSAQKTEPAATDGDYNPFDDATPQPTTSNTLDAGVEG